MRFHLVSRHLVASDTTESRGGVRRWLRRSLWAIGGLVWLVVVALLIMVHELDRPWIKRHVQAIVRDAAGVDVDYRAVAIGLSSGAVIEGLVVHSPGEVRGLAPDLLVVDRVEARWSPRSLLGGHGPAVERLAVMGVALTVVVDEKGRTSFDALPSTSPSTDTPLPLSHRPASIFAGAPPVGPVTVDGIALTLVRTEHGRAAERTDLRGVSLAVEATPDPHGWRMAARLGAPAAPLALDVERQRAGAPAGAARAALWLTIDATASSLAGALDVRVLEQTLAPDLRIQDRFHAEAHVQFDPSAGRTAVSLDHMDVGDGAASLDAALDLPDVGSPLVRHAQGDLDLARLLRWVPAGMVPVTAERARVHYAIDALVLESVPRLAGGGTLVVDADLAGVKADVASGAMEISRGTLTVHGQPAEGGGVSCTAAMHLENAQVATGGERLDVDALAFALDARQGADGAVTGHAGLGFARASRQGATPLTVRDGQVDLRVEGFRPGDADPLGQRGDVALSVALASIDATSARGRAILDHVTVEAHTRLDGHAPYGAELDSRASRVRVLGSGDRSLADAPVALQARLQDVVPDREHPGSSRGVLHAAATLGELQVSVDATKAVDAVDFAVHGVASSLRALTPLLAPDLAARAPWARMALTVGTTGRIERLNGTNPLLHQTTHVGVDHPAFGDVAASSIVLDLRSNGTALQHDVDADLRAQALTLAGGNPGDDRVTVAATLNRQAPSLRLRVETTGRVSSKLAASLSFDRRRRAAVYDIDGTLAGVAPLAAIASRVRGLEGFDLSKLELGVSSRGALLGVVSSVGGDGAVGLEPDLLKTAGVEGTADVRVARFRWTRGDTAIVTPAASWHGDMHVEGSRRTLDSRVAIDALHLDVGSREINLSGIADETSASVTGDLANPQVELKVRTAIRDVQQDTVPRYPIGGLNFTVSAARDPDGLVHVSEMKLVNDAGGTSLGLTGSLDLGARRRRLSLSAQLAQDLAPLSSAPERFSGRGKVSMDAKIDSPDLSLFRSHVDLKVDDVHARAPGAGIDIEAANGVIPTTVTFALGAGEQGKTKISFPRDERANPYQMLRFADQHALLSRTGFISIGSIKTPFVSVAPLAGNLAIDQNVVSLSQFEMGVRGGRITGQCAFDWDGPRSTVELHVRATGVQSSHGEPFDGNVAVVVAAGDRTVEGRAEVTRIGPRHLLDLLDMEDPTRTDDAMNRVRGALAFGYPKRLRLVFDHGFASAHLEMGGLASLVSIGDLTGMPMGPIVDRFLGPVLDTKEAP